MKKRLTGKTNKAPCLTSLAIVLANSPTAQQAFALLALLLMRGVLGYE